GTRTFSGASFSGNGTLHQSGGILVGSFTAPNTFEWSGGSESGPGTTTIPGLGTLTLTTGCCSSNLDAGRVLTNTGTISLGASHYLYMGDGTLITNNGTFTMGDNSVIADNHPVG